MLIEKSFRLSYHSDLKIAFKLGLVPVEIAKKVPRSTKYRFRTTDYSQLVGSEFSDFLDKLDLVKNIMSSRSTIAVATAFLRIVSLLRSLHLPVGALPKIKNMEVRSQIVKRILSVSKLIPLGKILSLLKLSPRRFQIWKKKTLPCPSSPLGRCRVSFPFQLAKGEVLSIRKAFSDPKTAHWPATSVAWKLIRDKIISANVSTILKYARTMGLTSARKPPHRSRKKGSIVTTRPNKAWHIDVTVLRTQDGVRSFIQLIIDSFSKRILAFSVSLSISGQATAALLRSAFESTFPKPEEPIMLISDGGSENVNVSVREYLTSVPLKLHVAHVDVAFSNSMIEAVNKILKYRYIFPKNIQSYLLVEPVIRESITNYNARPHYSNHGLSPNETYAGKTFDFSGYKERLLVAREQRLTENRKTIHPCMSIIDEII